MVFVCKFHCFRTTTFLSSISTKCTYTPPVPAIEYLRVFYVVSMVTVEYFHVSFVVSMVVVECLHVSCGQKCPWSKLGHNELGSSSEEDHIPPGGDQGECEHRTVTCDTSH